ncbi:SNF1-related protein kinase regulatory subunit gamma-1 [Vitis vinifera]|uniref:SNF1-related protein kinase regulatory subunit gamma-1 n=1 Tax=Vitis vinifera TaxID=29760 RepID=A0A438EYP8_VITVI|nr:SNF1-related protein kinase regulatory subunit gamma-1 [Vitis vinifera]
MEDSPRSGGMSSPEAKLGMRVEDLWDVQEPQLTPTEKLNACFESVPVSAFPPASSQGIIQNKSSTPFCSERIWRLLLCSSSVLVAAASAYTMLPLAIALMIEIKSDCSLAEAVQILTKHRILSAPVVDVEAPEDASWIDRYIGIVEFAGIVVWILYQSELASPRKNGGAPAAGFGTGGKEEAITAVAAAANGMNSPRRLKNLGFEPAEPTPGSFFEALTSSEFYKNTKVRDISGSFRWAPFLALQKSNSFLTMLLLLSNYKMKSVPVVDLGEGKIDNIVTQSAVIHMLAECVGLSWFERWGAKKMSELGLPTMKPDQVIKVNEDEPVLQAFKLMRKKGIGGIPVVESGGRKAVGNISIRDVQFLLTTPEIYREFRSITAKNFLVAVRKYLEQHNEASPMLSGMITCRRNQTVKEMILMLDSVKIQRVYVVDEDGNLEGVITLRDIISKLVHEPRGYFGDFFDGVLPMPQNSRV